MELIANGHRPRRIACCFNGPKCHLDLRVRPARFHRLRTAPPPQLAPDRLKKKRERAQNSA